MCELICHFSWCESTESCSENLAEVQEFSLFLKVWIQNDILIDTLNFSFLRTWDYWPAWPASGGDNFKIKLAFLYVFLMAADVELVFFRFVFVFFHSISTILLAEKSINWRRFRTVYWLKLLHSTESVAWQVTSAELAAQLAVAEVSVGRKMMQASGGPMRAVDSLLRARRGCVSGQTERWRTDR